jgi:formyl-CoA transferase
MQHRDDLQAELERTLATAPTAVWIERLVSAGVVAGPILDYAQLLEAEHTRASEMVVEVDHPKRGRVKTLGTPIKLSSSPAWYRAAPLLGEHTDEILAELGLPRERIARLRAESIL